MSRRQTSSGRNSQTSLPYLNAPDARPNQRASRSNSRAGSAAGPGARSSSRAGSRAGSRSESASRRSESRSNSGRNRGQQEGVGSQRNGSRGRVSIQGAANVNNGSRQSREGSRSGGSRSRAPSQAAPNVNGGSRQSRAGSRSNGSGAHREGDYADIVDETRSRSRSQGSGNGTSRRRTTTTVVAVTNSNSRSNSAHASSSRRSRSQSGGSRRNGQNALSRRREAYRGDNNGGATRMAAAERGEAELQRYDRHVDRILSDFSISSCPSNYPYFRTVEGYLCGAGLCFVSYYEVDAMMQGRRPLGPRVESVNTSGCRQVIVPPTAYNMPMHTRAQAFAFRTGWTIHPGYF